MALGHQPLVSQPPVHWGITHRQSAFFSLRFVLKTLHRTECTAARRGRVQNTLRWEVITAGTEPLEWESELRRDVGPCLWGVSTSAIKADVIKSRGREALPAPGQPRASSDTPDTPGTGSMSGVQPDTSDRGRVVPIISSTSGNGCWLPSLQLGGRWHLMVVVGSCCPPPVVGLSEPGGSRTA